MWNKIANKNDGTKSIQLACENGHFKMANMLIEKATKLKIDVNARNEYQRTPFHLVCKYGNFEISQMLLNESTELHIDLNWGKYQKYEVLRG